MLPVSSILVYTDGEVMGDGILRLIFAQAIKQASPDTKLTWLSTEQTVYRTALKEMAGPLIEELIVLPVRKLTPFDIIRPFHPLHGRRFDVVIDTQLNAKRTLWLKRIRHKRFISASADQWFSERMPDPISPHFLDRLLQMGSFALGKPLTKSPLPLPPGNWREEAATLLPDGSRYIGFVVGSTHPSKIWPIEHFMRLAKECEAQNDTAVIFLGPSEREQYAELKAALPTAKFPLNETANPSPHLTIALGERLTAAVGNDSGGTHLLAAGNAPLVTLFRSNRIRHKFTPVTSRVITFAPEDCGVTTLPEIPYEPVREALWGIVGDVRKALPDFAPFLSSSL